MSLLEDYEAGIRSFVASSTSKSLPSCITSSPVGFHAIDLPAYLQIRSTRLSSEPDRLPWATEAAAQKLGRKAHPTPGDIIFLELFVYNITCKSDRICPSCRRIYMAGEGLIGRFSYDRWLERDTEFYDAVGWDMDEADSIQKATVEAQRDSGVCSSLCYAMLTGGFEDMSEKELGAWVHGSAETLVSLQQSASLGGWVMRKTTAEEEEATGMKTMWD